MKTFNFFIALLAILLIASCNNRSVQSDDIGKITDLKQIADRHSKGLDFFFNKSCEDNKKSNYGRIETRGDKSDFIDMPYIMDGLSSCEFKEVSFNSQTRSFEDVGEKVHRYLDEIMPINSSHGIRLVSNRRVF